MKTLIWKEWREMRFIPAAFCMLFAIANLFFLAVQYFVDHSPATHGTMPGGIYTINAVLIVATACILLATVVCGGNIVSHERDKGTLPFLTSLPLNRQSLWFAKAWLGFAVAGAASLGIAAIAFSFIACRFGVSAIRSLYHASFGTATIFELLTLFALGLTVLMVVYAISYATSCLMDHTLAAIVLSLFCCFAIAALAVGATSVLGYILSQKLTECRNQWISVREFNYYLPLFQFIAVRNWWAIIFGALLTLAAIMLQISYISFGATGDAQGARRFLPALRIVARWTITYASLGAAAYLIGLYTAFHTVQPLQFPRN